MFSLYITSFVVLTTVEVIFDMFVGKRADCSCSLCRQLMKSMRAMCHAYPARIIAQVQEKEDHRQPLIALHATDGRGPVGGACLAGLDALNDYFSLPSAASQLPHLHTRRAYARRLCSFGVGHRTSRRAPTGFAGFHAQPIASAGPAQDRFAFLSGCGSSANAERAGRPPLKAGGRAPLRSLADGALPPTTRPRLGALKSLGRFLLSGSPRTCALMLGHECFGGLLVRLHQHPIARIRCAPSTLMRGLANG
jgi:hypothetical protein